MNKYDRRRKYYVVLDCESATLPFANKYEESNRKNVAIARPLIYDLGWTVIDNKGRIYAKKNYLITETFFVPAVFDTAYYKAQRPIYMEKLAKGEIIQATWNEAVHELIEDLEAVEAVGAYNAMFDYKKALPFTDLYISKLYSNDYNSWMKTQERICDSIAKCGQTKSNPDFDEMNFCFRGEKYPMFDLWGLTCKHILNCDDYKRMCVDNNWSTASGLYFPTNAEKAFAFVSAQMDFEEAHTAIEDAEIETALFAIIYRKTKGKFEMGIEFFPFRILGKIEHWGG